MDPSVRGVPFACRLPRQRGPYSTPKHILDTPEAKPTPEETFIWVVTKSNLRWVRSELGRPALAREVAALRCGLDAASWDGDGAGKCAGLLKIAPDRAPKDGDLLPFNLERAHALYKALFGEAEDLIKGKSLIIVPSGPLTQLPFQVLVTKPASSGGYKSAAWLARDHALTVLPAVSSLKALRRVAHQSAAKKPMIGFGNPLLDGEQSHPRYGDYFKRRAALSRKKKRCPEMLAPTPLQRLAALAGLRGGVAPLAMRGGLSDAGLLKAQAPLPETADELCAVARDLKADLSEMRLGARATEREVKSLSASGALAQYRVVHFATHGVLAGQLDPKSEPGLILTPPETASEEDDGYLSASEIAGLKLDADWVILSACNTAAGGAAGAEALSGIARAFFYAQARALLVSHWAVNSDATVKLITSAVREMSRDKRVGRAEALRRAMLALIDTGKPEEAHPAYWAPFVVVGEGAATPIWASLAGVSDGGPVKPRAVKPGTELAKLSSAPAKPAAVSLPGTSEVSGQISWIEDTSTLIVEGKTVKLFGVKGRGKPYIQKLQRYLARFEGGVRCKPMKAKYSCFVVSRGYDVGMAAIFLGYAYASPEAPESYRNAQMKAQISKRGVWQSGVSITTPR